jgi:SsrA-binding protein
MNIAINKKARFDYDVLETLEAGIALTGQEVKSLRTEGARLSGCFITFLRGKPQITNLRIAPYQNTKRLLAPAERSRAILLHKHQIASLRGKIEQKGLTIVPLSLYTKGQLIKLEIALVRGKKAHDKRETIKKRDRARQAARGIME